MEETLRTNIWVNLCHYQGKIQSKFVKSLKSTKTCDLSLALKASAFNNMALAKIFQHFYNSRLSEEQLDHMDAALTKIICQLYGLYETTTQLVITFQEIMVV